MTIFLTVFLTITIKESYQIEYLCICIVKRLFKFLIISRCFGFLFYRYDLAAFKKNIHTHRNDSIFNSIFNDNNERKSSNRIPMYLRSKKII